MDFTEFWSKLDLTLGVKIDSKSFENRFGRPRTFQGLPRCLHEVSEKPPRPQKWLREASKRSPRRPTTASERVPGLMRTDSLNFATASNLSPQKAAANLHHQLHDVNELNEPASRYQVKNEKNKTTQHSFYAKRYVNRESTPLAIHS